MQISEYELQINDLEHQINRLLQESELKTQSFKSIDELKETERLELKSKISSLHQEIETLQNLNRNPTDNNVDEAVNTDRIVNLQNRDTRMRRRIVELEALVDQQALRIEQLIMDKTNLQKDLSFQLKEKDEIILSYESKLVIMQRDVRDKIFLTSESDRIHELHHVQRELDATKIEVELLKQKLEISEGTRQAIHDTTSSILKQTQQQSSKLALDHHQRALEMLRQEWRNEARAHGQQLLESQGHQYSAQIKELESRLQELNIQEMKLNDEKQSLGHQLQECEKQLLELKMENDELRNALDRSKESWPPSMHKFEALSTHISKLEKELQDRQKSLSQFMTAPSFEHDEKMKLIRLLDVKDGQIRAFQSEMAAVIQGFSLLRNQRTFT